MIYISLLVEIWKEFHTCFSKEINREIKEALPKFKRPFKKIQKVLIMTLMLVGLGINSGFANEEENEDLSTIFHIYSKGEYVGVISDEEKLEELKEQELQKAASEFENLPLTIGTDLSVIPERVFTAETDDDIVLEKLQEMLSVEAEAIGVSIDGELAFYVNDMATYDEVIRQTEITICYRTRSLTNSKTAQPLLNQYPL